MDGAAFGPFSAKLVSGNDSTVQLVGGGETVQRVSPNGSKSTNPSGGGGSFLCLRTERGGKSGELAHARSRRVKIGMS